MTLSARRFAIAVLLILFATRPQVADASPNPLSGMEVAARQTAVHVLDLLKPLESLTESSEVVTPSSSETQSYVEVTGTRVNLRVSPTLSSDVLRVALQGEVFPLDGEEGDWYRLRTDDGKIAFISRSFSHINEIPVRTPESSTQVERLRPGSEKQAGEILATCRPGVATLARLAQNAEDTYKRGFGSVTGGDDAERREAENSLRKINKYNRIVGEKLNHYAALTGQGAVRPAARVSRPSARLRGTVRAGLGSNSATTEVVGTGSDDTDVTRTELAADVTAVLSPDDVLGISAAYNKEIRFAPSSQTRAALDYDRRLGANARIGTRVGLDNYADEANDQNDINRTELGLRGSVAPSPQFRANATLGLTGAAHPNADMRDYKDTRIAVGAMGEASPSVSWGADFSHAAHDLDDNTTAEDNTRGQLRGHVSFKTGDKSSVSMVGESESFSFDSDDNPGNYAKRSLGLQGQHRGRPGHATTWLLEMESKGYDVDKDRKYTEFHGEFRSRDVSDSRNPQRSLLSANYRNYKGKGDVAYLDYIEGRWDIVRSRGGFFWESNNYIQYFFDSEGAERNARVSQFVWLGLALGAQRAVEVGPHLAANTELVTVDGTDQGVFESDNNTFRYGVKGTVRVDARPLRVRGRGRWEKTSFYNVDGASAPTRTELEGDAAYELSRLIDATLRLKYYATGADDIGAIKTSEFDILFGLMYMIGGRR